MTVKQILKLRPTFKFGNMAMVDWFIITQSGSFFSIRSGLTHADGETKSPYYYDNTITGRSSEKQSLYIFTKWWEAINKID